MAAAAQNVSFDILLGGKVTPEVIAALKSMEEKLKAFGATTKTVNAVMGRAYKETFEGAAKEGHKAFGQLEHESKSAFSKMAEHAKEASEKIREQFEKVSEARKKMFEFFGISGVIGAVGAAFTGEELIKHGTEVFMKRQEALDTLAATLRGRGREDLLPGYKEAIETLAKQAPIGYEASADIMRKMAGTGKFRGPEEAERFARALSAVSGGTRETTETAFSAFERMLLGGKVTPKGVAGISKGTGFNIMDQIRRDTGIQDLSKAFGPKGGIGAAQQLQLLQKAIIELGSGPAAGILEARLKGTQGLFYRLGEDWENFLNKVGELWTDIIDPIANSINEWLDSINWEKTFEGLIEKAKEWGQTIKNVMTLVFDSPVIKRFQAMWDGFMQRIVGGEMYGPWVRAWTDATHKKIQWERQLTPAGKKFMETGASAIETVLNKIADAFGWFIDHGKDVWWWVTKIGEAFVALSVINVVTPVIQLGVALANLGLTIVGLTSKLSAATVAAGGTAAGGGALTKGLAGAGWLEQFWEEQEFLKQMKMPEADRLKYLQQQAGQKPTIEIPGINAPLDPTVAKRMNENTERQTDNLKKSQEALEKHRKATESATGAIYGHSPGLIPALNDATSALSTFASGLFGMGAGYGGGPTGPGETEYGPGVAGDQPGQATYDWNSYHHVGAWPSITGPLRMGDVALGYGAQQQYHVQPGQSFMTASGHWVRFADRSGSSNPYNIDYFRGAEGGIVRRPTFGLIGEAGPEALLPLNRAGGFGGTTVTVNFNGDIGGVGSGDPRSVFREFAELIASEVKRVIGDEHRRSAVI